MYPSRQICFNPEDNMTDLMNPPDDLPVPQDDGAASHLKGMKLPSLALESTRGGVLDLSGIQNWLVVYCYPMTGRPDVPLPEGWDAIPGARGCTPQSCSFRDHYRELQQLGAEVVGLSNQTRDYQKEMAERLHLPFAVLSDHEMKLANALDLPTFEVAGMTLLKRLTLICRNGLIEAVHYPVFPTDQDPVRVMDYLKKAGMQGPKG